MEPRKLNSGRERRGRKPKKDTVKEDVERTTHSLRTWGLRDRAATLGRS